MKARVTQKPLGTCCICGKIIRNEFDSNNPWPIRPYSSIGEKENRCCKECNDKYVVTFRILNLGEGEEYDENVKVLQQMSKQELDNFMEANGIKPFFTEKVEIDEED